MRKLSRLEANKEVRRVLNRHGVDLSNCQYSVAGSDIRLTGYLCRHDGSDFGAKLIEALVQDCMRFLPGFSVNGQFDNWSFSTDHVTYLGKESEEEAPAFYEDYESEAS